MRRRWVAAGIALVVVGVGAGVAVQQLTRTDRRTTARTLDEALDEFRTGADSQQDVAAAVPVLPSPGVYVYRTTGSDGVDALGGASHAYPSSTTITVRAAECGVTERWDVAVERWDETSVCATEGGIERSSFVAYHQFFNTGNTDYERCTGDPRPLGADDGTTWSFECAEDDEVTAWSGTVLGEEALVVSGVEVMTDHVLLVTTSDPDRDDMRIETWYLAGNDLIVREIGSRRTTDPSPIGDVHYREEYEIVLTALDPLR